MNDLDERIKLVQQNKEELERFLLDYLPFIKKQIVNKVGYEMEYDDMLSIAMMVFTNCIRQYCIGKGNFFSFAQVSIRNRLIDEQRKSRNRGIVIPILSDNEEEGQQTAEDSASILQYDREEERKNLCGEIDDLSQVLGSFEITIPELARICPRQKRARAQCLNMAEAIIKNDRMKTTLLKYRKISQSELAQKFQVSPKTIEKHRKYIVALAVLLSGDFPAIKAFLPQTEEVSR